MHRGSLKYLALSLMFRGGAKLDRIIRASSSPPRRYHAQDYRNPQATSRMPPVLRAIRHREAHRREGGPGWRLELTRCINAYYPPIDFDSDLCASTIGRRLPG
jgi:hypothetical protein